MVGVPIARRYIIGAALHIADIRDQRTLQSNIVSSCQQKLNFPFQKLNRNISFFFLRSMIMIICKYQIQMTPHYSVEVICLFTKCSNPWRKTSEMEMLDSFGFLMVFSLGCLKMPLLASASGILGLGAILRLTGDLVLGGYLLTLDLFLTYLGLEGKDLRAGSSTCRGRASGEMMKTT